jgi:prenylcysteine oxidase / farnesylcysteine lyase
MDRRWDRHWVWWQRQLTWRQSKGAGAAGSSTAYHLQQFASEENLNVNITLFEKTGHIGGRTLTVDIYGAPEQPIELGASVFIDVNYILYNSAFAFNLTLGELRDSEPGDLTAIWDGEAVVFQTESGSSWWWDAARMWWRYGRSPYKAVQLVKSTIHDFLKLYEPPYFPFRSLTQRAFELELTKKTGITGMELLDQNGVRSEMDA